jgi:hypothetical protein
VVTKMGSCNNKRKYGLFNDPKNFARVGNKRRLCVL